MLGYGYLLLVNTCLMYKEINNQLLSDNKKGNILNKKLVETIKHYQTESLNGLDRFLCDFFEDEDYIGHHIIHLSKDGKLTIKIGEEDNWVLVDMDHFKTNSIGALTEARTQYIEKMEN